jgi:hypothetical protein
MPCNPASTPRPKSSPAKTPPISRLSSPNVDAPPSPARRSLLLEFQRRESGRQNEFPRRPHHRLRGQDLRPPPAPHQLHPAQLPMRPDRAPETREGGAGGGAGASACHPQCRFHPRNWLRSFNSRNPSRPARAGGPGASACHSGPGSTRIESTSHPRNWLRSFNSRNPARPARPVDQALSPATPALVQPESNRINHPSPKLASFLQLPKPGQTSYAS